MLHETLHYFVDEVGALVTYQLYRATVFALDALVQEFRCVIAQIFGFHPLGTIIRSHYDMFVASMGCCWLEWAYKVQPPLLKWF